MDSVIYKKTWEVQADFSKRCVIWIINKNTLILEKILLLIFQIWSHHCQKVEKFDSKCSLSPPPLKWDANDHNKKVLFQQQIEHLNINGYVKLKMIWRFLKKLLSFKGSNSLRKRFRILWFCSDRHKNLSTIPRFYLLVKFLDTQYIKEKKSTFYNSPKVCSLVFFIKE